MHVGDRTKAIASTGTYTVRVANTVWRLTGFAVDTPDMDGKFRFDVRHRDLTADERQDCAGDPEDSSR